MNPKAHSVGVMVCVVGVASQALGGPVWEEHSVDRGDAGAFPNEAQQTQLLDQAPPNTQLNEIRGKLDGQGAADGAGDFQDMYLVRIADPSTFLISTATADGGSTDFDSQLWIFDGRPGRIGLGITANDEAGIIGVDGPDGSLGSALGLAPSDGSPAQSFSRGDLIYVAISGFDSDPLGQFVTGGFEFIFDQARRREISGPDGEAGTLPIARWSEDGSFGAYTIRLRGATFAVPTPGAGAVFAAAGVLGLRRRRRH